MDDPRTLLLSALIVLLTITFAPNAHGRFYPDDSLNLLKSTYFVYDSWMIRDAAVDYLDAHPDRGLRHITYGELVRGRFLPSSYCKQTPDRNKNGIFTCGGTSPGVEEFRRARGPVLKKDFERQSLIFLFPYRDPSTKTVRFIRRVSDHAKLNFGRYREHVILYQFFGK